MKKAREVARDDEEIASAIPAVHAGEHVTRLRNARRKVSAGNGSYSDKDWIVRALFWWSERPWKRR